MLLGYTFYEIVWYFLAYSFLGWCLEVIYCTVMTGRPVNRGFLNGPVCPIYGFGMLAVLMALRPLLSNAGPGGSIALFLGGMVLASAVELAGGWAMLKLFHARWWDYRDRPFHIGGFICLQMSLCWGLSTLVACRVLHPLVQQLTQQILPAGLGLPLLVILYAVYAADAAASALTMVHLNRDLDELEKLAAALDELSERMSTELGSRALQADQKMDEGRLQAKLAGYELRDAAEQTADRLEQLGDRVAADLTDRVRKADQKWDEGRLQVILAGYEARDAARQLQSRVDALHGNVLNKRFGGRRLLQAFPHLDTQAGRQQLAQLKAELAQRFSQN